MAKKSVKASPFDALKEDEAKIATELKAEEQNVQQPEADVVRPPAFEKREYSREELKKLDIYDATTAANQKLVAENSELTEHCAEYLQQIEDLKAELKKAKDENDAYLMKISELTFELAKAQAALDNAKSTIATKQIQQNINQHISKVVPYPRTNRNGYSDWN